jgi:hypothetical protein
MNVKSCCFSAYVNKEEEYPIFIRPAMPKLKIRVFIFFIIPGLWRDNITSKMFYEK